MTAPAGAIRRTLAAVRRKTLRDDAAAVGEALQPEAFFLDADARDKAAALRLAARHFERVHGLNATLVFDALDRRERAGSTALGDGFAIPHARLPGIARTATVFIRLDRAIAFDAADGVPVGRLLVIVVPRDGADGDHLRMLALIADLFSMRGFRRRIDAASTAAMAADAFRRSIAKCLGATRD